jgi:KUP system potassium uptake protein
VFLTILVADVPAVAAADRMVVTPLAEGFWRIVARYGFTDEPDIPALLSSAGDHGLEYRAAETTYFLGRETIISSAKPGMAGWRERLFGVMVRNASPATAYFRIPPNRVVELGAQVEI